MSQENWEEYNGISTLVRICRETVKLDANMLSWAAKVHYILSSQGKSMTPDKIQNTAGSFGWKLSEPQIDEAIELLNQLYSVK